LDAPSFCQKPSRWAPGVGTFFWTKKKPPPGVGEGFGRNVKNAVNLPQICGGFRSYRRFVRAEERSTTLPAEARISASNCRDKISTIPHWLAADARSITLVRRSTGLSAPG